MEEVHKKRKADRAADLENRLQALEQKSYPTKNISEPSTVPNTEISGPLQNNLNEPQLPMPPTPVHRPPGVGIIPGTENIVCYIKLI